MGSVGNPGAFVLGHSPAMESGLTTAANSQRNWTSSRGHVTGVPILAAALAATAPALLVDRGLETLAITGWRL